MVVPEYRLPNNQIADYVLYNDGDPAIVVESKKLDESLRGGKALDQGILYCAHTGASYFILTDGNSWELYEAGTTSPITSFGLTGGSAADACLKALALWRPSVISGQIAVGETPVIGLPDNRTNATEPQPTEETTVQSTPSVSDKGAWLPISDFSLPEGHSGFQAEILFPDDKQVPIKTGKGIMIEVTRWLVDKNILTKSHCPISFGNNRYLVSTSPEHPTGSPFRNNPFQKGDIHIDTNYTRKDLIKNTQLIIEHVGQDPAQFKVRLP